MGTMCAALKLSGLEIKLPQMPKEQQHCPGSGAGMNALIVEEHVATERRCNDIINNNNRGRRPSALTDTLSFTQTM